MVLFLLCLLFPLLPLFLFLGGGEGDGEAKEKEGEGLISTNFIQFVGEFEKAMLVQMNVEGLVGGQVGG